MTTVLDSPAAQPATPTVPSEPSARRTRLRSHDDRLQRPELDWLVEHVIPPQGVGQIHGPSGVGKTFVAIDLALRIANPGLADWYGHDVMRHGPVVFVLMEGVQGFQTRLDAWTDEHPHTSSGDIWTLENESVDLIDPQSCKRIIEDCQLAHVTPRLVVIDTQGLATPGADENDNSQMNRVFANLKSLSKHLDCPIVTIAHPGRGETHRERGASAQRQACDFSVSVQDGEVKVVKVKEWEQWEKGRAFELVKSGDSLWAKPSPTLSPSKRQEVLDYIIANNGELTERQVLRRFPSGRRFLHSLQDEYEVYKKPVTREEGGKRQTRTCYFATQCMEIIVEDD